MISIYPFAEFVGESNIVFNIMIQLLNISNYAVNVWASVQPLASKTKLENGNKQKVVFCKYY